MVEEKCAFSHLLIYFFFATSVASAMHEWELWYQFLFILLVCSPGRDKAVLEQVNYAHALEVVAHMMFFYD